MTNGIVSQDFSAIATVGNISAPWSNTSELFNADYLDGGASALDNYIKNTTELNRLWINEASVSPEFGRLLLLGYVSAVESYVRNILRRLIHEVQVVQERAHLQMVQYGAVLYHDKNVLPEALLDHTSFASKDEICGVLQKYLDLQLKKDDRVAGHLDVFDKICQLRHCCAHRFGKLGARNALILGINDHKHILEKPVLLDINSLQSIVSWLMSFTKLLNNIVFQKVLIDTCNRKEKYHLNWQWSYRKDKAKYSKLYNLFHTTQDANISPSIEEMYNRFKSAKQPTGA